MLHDATNHELGIIVSSSRAASLAKIFVESLRVQRCRGFFVLAHAASTLKLDDLRSFTDEAADATCGSGILHQPF